MMFKLIGLAFTFILFSGVQTLTAQSVTGLGGWDVFIDPGHSQTENMGVHNYSEAQKVLQVALNLKQILLENTDVDTVYVSRLNDNVVVSLSQRTDYANSLNADFYHSIHSDAGSSTAETTLLLWGGWFQGGNTSNPIVEKTPNGGQAMGDFMTDYLTKGMRVRENLNQANAADKRSQIFAVDSNINLEAVKWESGNLIFTNAPIADVVNAIETRYGKKLQASNQTSDLQFTGIFKNTDEFSTVVKTIEIALGLQFEVK